ncbi:MAG: YtxH domain-containing protein [Bacillota bacterium]
MRRTFWRGLLTGGVVGAVMGMLMAPQRRPVGRVAMATDRMQRRAVRLWRRTRGEIGAMTARLKK